MNHKWGKWNSLGVATGRGRPHGVDVWRECKNCGTSMGSGPWSTSSGKRVIRRWVEEENGKRYSGWEYIPSCY